MTQDLTLKEAILYSPRGTWLLVFTPDKKIESQIIDKIKETFEKYHIYEANVSEREPRESLAQFFKKHIKIRGSKAKKLLIIRGFDELTSKNKRILTYLEYEHKTLFKIKGAIIIVFANQEFKDAFQTKTPHFWRGIKQKFGFNSVDEAGFDKNLVLSRQAAEKAIPELLREKQKINKSNLPDKEKFSKIFDIDMQLVDYYCYAEDYDEALEIISAYRDTNLDASQKANLLEKKALFLMEIGEPEESMEYCEETLNLRKKLHTEDNATIGKIYLFMMLNSLALGRLASALDYGLKAQEIFKQTLPENHPDIAIVYNNLSIIYLQVDDYSKAAEYAQKAYEIFEQYLPDTYYEAIHTIINYISAMAVSIDFPEFLLPYIDTALEIYKKASVNEPLLLVDIYNHATLLHLQMGDFDTALSYAKKAVKILTDNGYKDDHYLFELYKLIATIYLAMGDEKNARKYEQKLNELM